jgi:hypothetical protein
MVGSIVESLTEKLVGREYFVASHVWQQCFLSLKKERFADK